MSLWNRLAFLVVVVALAGGCSKTANPEVCCTDPTDCASIGAEEDNRPCPTALTCVNHECVVPDCSTQGCAALAPVCNLASNACEGCTTNADCSNFPDELRCLVETGSCVQCVASNDCNTGTPVCAGNQCRKCERDSECASGGCADDGTCLAESAIAYVDPVGDDTGECTKATPCRSIKRAVSRITPTRTHIVVVPASYAITGGITVGGTGAALTTIHGNGAALVGDFGDPVFIGQAMALRDLKFQQTNGGSAVRISGSSAMSTLDRITVESNIGLELFGQARLRDVTLTATLNKLRGIDLGATTVDLDRVVIKGFDVGIVAGSNGSASATIRNAVITDCGTRAADLINTTGIIEFSTLVTQGPGTSVGARGVQCAMSGLTVRASILWSPGGATPVLQGCTAVSTIVGPTPVAGSSSDDPMFVNLAGGDFHLQTLSPARDKLDTGPMTDVLGNQRPVGGKFDFGAYEQ
jgi:hypothetical protein